MAGIGFSAQYLKERQRESGSLAGAGLGGAQQVFAGEDYGDGLRLDGGGGGVALLGDSAEQLGLEPE
jgi:hypothetical protein